MVTYCTVNEIQQRLNFESDDLADPNVRAQIEAVESLIQAWCDGNDIAYAGWTTYANTPAEIREACRNGALAMVTVILKAGGFSKIDENIGKLVAFFWSEYRKHIREYLLSLNLAKFQTDLQEGGSYEEPPVFGMGAYG